MPAACVTGEFSFSRTCTKKMPEKAAKQMKINVPTFVLT